MTVSGNDGSHLDAEVISFLEKIVISNTTTNNEEEEEKNNSAVVLSQLQTEAQILLKKLHEKWQSNPNVVIPKSPSEVPDGMSDTSTVITEEFSSTSSLLAHSSNITPFLDLAILSASPLVFKKQHKHRQHIIYSPLPSLNVRQEQLYLNRIFTETNRKLFFSTDVATVDSLRKMLDKGITALHFSCHGGAVNTKNDSNDVLLFEDPKGTGLAHVIDAQILRNILFGKSGLEGSSSSNTHQQPKTLAATEDDENSTPVDEEEDLQRGVLRFVFVSSCHSRQVGEVFIQAGVKYVVCVRRSERIMDESCIIFARAFYHAILNEKNVRQSFEIARGRVSADIGIPANESDKFVLLENLDLHDLHCNFVLSSPPEISNGSHIASSSIEVDFSKTQCKCLDTLPSLFGNIPYGKLVDKSPYLHLPKNLPSVSEENFVGRQEDMFNVASLVVSQRFVTIRGPPGIGKTTLALQTSYFLYKRNIFHDGVFFISALGVTAVESLEATIKSILMDCSNNDQDCAPERSTSLRQFLSGKKMLLILDNMEDPLNSNQVAVCEFLQTSLLEASLDIVLLLTSRQSVGINISGAEEKVFSVSRLSPLNSARLFTKKCPRSLCLQSDLLADKEESETSSSASFSRVLLGKLASHPLLVFLDGHPQAIALCAPLLQDRNLPELTELILSRGVRELQVADLEQHDRSALNTLITSLEVSLDQVRKLNPEAVRFLALLGLLPSGGMPVDFDSIWPESNSDWRLHIRTLQKLSLVEKTQVTRSNKKTILLAFESYARHLAPTNSNSSNNSECSPSKQKILPDASLNCARKCNDEVVSKVQKRGKSVRDHFFTFPFITSFARRLLGIFDGEYGYNTSEVSPFEKDRDYFLLKTAQHFAEVSEWLFQHICTLGENSLAAYAILDLHESNFWMCLDRHVEFITGKKKQDPSQYRAKHHTMAVPSDSELDKTDSDVVYEETTKKINRDDAVEEEIENGCEKVQTPEVSDTLSVKITNNTTSSNNIKTPRRIKKSINRTKQNKLLLGRKVGELACYFAQVLFLAGRSNGAMRAGKKGLLVCKHYQDTRGEAHLQKLLGVILTSSKKFDRAKMRLGLAQIAYQAINSNLGQAASLSAIGTIHFRKGTLRAAHKCFTEALELYRYQNHILGQLTCHKRLAILERKCENNRQRETHHYAAVRRLQGDLNRMKNANKYVIRWMGHEVDIHLEVPNENESSNANVEMSPASKFPVKPSSRSFRYRTENNPTTTTTTVANATTTTTTVSTSAPSGLKSPEKKLQISKMRQRKHSSFAKRREYDNSIRKKLF